MNVLQCTYIEDDKLSYTIYTVSAKSIRIAEIFIKKALFMEDKH